MTSRARWWPGWWVSPTLASEVAAATLRGHPFGQPVRGQIGFRRTGSDARLTTSVLPSWRAPGSDSPKQDPSTICPSPGVWWPSMTLTTPGSDRLRDQHQCQGLACGQDSEQIKCPLGLLASDTATGMRLVAAQMGGAPPPERSLRFGRNDGRARRALAGSEVIEWRLVSGVSAYRPLPVCGYDRYARRGCCRVAQ